MYSTGKKRDRLRPAGEEEGFRSASGAATDATVRVEITGVLGGARVTSGVHTLSRADHDSGVFQPGSIDEFAISCEDLGDIARAKGICTDCPVLAPCLEAAIERREPWGVWGGQLFRNGHLLATKRRRGRPPKVPRPEDQLPVVPIPAHLQAELRSA